MKKYIRLGIILSALTLVPLSAQSKTTIECDGEYGEGDIALTCEMEDDEKGNGGGIRDAIINGTILESLNNLNPDVKWTPSIDQLANLQARIIRMSEEGRTFDKIVVKNTEEWVDGTANNPEMDIKNDIDPDNPEDPHNKVTLIDPTNKDYYGVAKTIIDVPSLQQNILNHAYGYVTAVYAGDFDLNQKVRSSTVGMSRPYEILGGDILVSDESYAVFTNRYTFREMVTGGVTKADAVTAIYKALDKETRYNIQAGRYEAKADEGKYPQGIPIEMTPFINAISMNNAYINPKTYKTRVFVTRTLPEVYWTEATNAGIVNAFEKHEKITLGQFSQMVKDMLYLQGEEILNETEESILVSVYGKDLPYYLPQQQLDAVRYLIAKGIVTTDMKYGEPVNTDDILTILMRAKDPSSRVDFKKIDIEYNKELVDAGFYPTNAILDNSPIKDLQINTETSTASHYDYLIEKIYWYDKSTGKKNYPFTVFSQIDPEGIRREVGNPYLTSVAQFITADPLKDSMYVGSVKIEGKEYYHFKAPVNVSGDAVKDGQITVNTPTAPDLPTQLRLPIGGGIYTNPKEGGKKGEYAFLMERKPFPSDFSQVYVDSDRKTTAQDLENENIQLAKSSTKFTFKSTEEGLKTLLWDGKPLTESKVYSKNGEEHVISVTAEDPYKELLLHLSYKKNTSGKETVPAYVRDGKYALVSVNWLKKNKIITDIVEVEKGKKWILYSNKDNVLIDKANKMIVSGQIISEIVDTDTSPLLVEDPFSKDTLIDYRAVSGIANDYLVVKDTNGSITLSIPEIVNTTDKTVRVANLSGSGVNNLQAKDPKSRQLVSLEETYPVANYFIYRSRKGAVREDYLLVAKPSYDGSDKGVVDKAKELFKMDFNSDNIDIDLWQIGQKVLTDKGDLQTLSNVVFDPDTQEYYYRLPTIDTPEEVQTVFTEYMKKEGSASYPLPFVRYRSDLVLDLNINLMGEGTDLSTYPKKLKNNQFWLPVFGGDSEPTISEMKLAVTGITGILYPYEKATWSDMAHKDRVVYMGSLAVKVNYNVHETLTEYIKVTLALDANYKLADVTKESYSDKAFTEVFRGTNRSVYSYGVHDLFKATGFNDIQDSKWSDSLETLSSKTKNAFDFVNAFFEDWIGSLDDTLTVSILFLLNIVPRVMLFWFFLYATLALVHSNRLVQSICSKTVDVYKILSFGLSDINKLNVKSVWISTFFGIVLVAMMNASDFVKVISWMLRAIIGILR